MNLTDKLKTTLSLIYRVKNHFPGILDPELKISSSIYTMKWAYWGNIVHLALTDDYQIRDAWDNRVMASSEDTALAAITYLLDNLEHAETWQCPDCQDTWLLIPGIPLNRNCEEL